MITERLMSPGTWSLKLRDDTPFSVTDAIARFDHIVILPTRPTGSIDGFDDGDLLAAAVDGGYTGVITKQASPTSLAGHGLEWWAGTPKGYGVGTAGTQGLLTTAVTQTTATLSTWVTALCPPSLTVGTVTNTGLSTMTNTYQGLTRREALASVCSLLGAEYRVNADGTVDAADPDLLFTSTPTVVVTRRPGSTEPHITGINGSTIVTAVDVDDFFSKAVVVPKGTGAAVTTTTVAGTAAGLDLLGNTVHVERYIDAPDVPTTLATALGNAALAKYNAERRDLTLRSATYNITRDVRPGDTVWVFDQLAGLTDAANQVVYRGDVLTPLALRVTGLTWPVQHGMGVYCRHTTGAGTATWLDLSDYVAWDTGEVTWEVGAPRRRLVGSKAEYREVSTATLGVNPEVSARMAVGEAWPTATTPTVTQSGTVNVTWARLKVTKADRLVTFDYVGTVNASAGSPVAGNQVVVTLPYTAASSGHIIRGGGLIYDQTISQNLTGLPYLASTTTVGLVPNAANGLLGAVGGFTAALANGDLIQIAGSYEAAS